MNQSKVLIADDNASIRKVMAQFLNAGDRSVLTAEDGESALEMARRHLPDLIILDVRMPGRDGHQVCSALRDGESTRGIPILMITGMDESEAACLGIGSGAGEYLAKPFNFNVLKDRVDALLGRRSR